MRLFLIYECSVRLIWPSTSHTIKNNIIEKSVHTSDGVLIGNIHDIDNDSVVVKSNIKAAQD